MIFTLRFLSLHDDPWFTLRFHSSVLRSSSSFYDRSASFGFTVRCTILALRSLNCRSVCSAIVVLALRLFSLHATIAYLFYDRLILDFNRSVCLCYELLVSCLYDRPSVVALLSVFTIVRLTTRSSCSQCLTEVVL